MQDWANLAQVVATIITSAGVIVSLWASVRAVRESQIDRRLRLSPHLVIDHGGTRYRLRFAKMGRRVPGINPDLASTVLAGLPEDSESVLLAGSKDSNSAGAIIGVRNVGLGPAFCGRITFIPRRIKIGSDSFQITQAKLREPLYSRALNTIPLTPSNIAPGEAAQFFRLPTFINKDVEKKIEEVTGVVELECEDAFGNSSMKRQSFRIHTSYKSESLVLTFSGPVDDEEEGEGPLTPAEQRSLLG